MSIPKRAARDSGPLLPSEASTILTFVAGMIGLGGAYLLLAVAIIGLGAITGGASELGDWRVLLVLLLMGGIGVAYCLTGVWLYQARRRGAYLAMAALGLNVVSLLLSPARPSIFDIGLPVAALIGLAFAWPHLSEAGREVDETVRVTPPYARRGPRA
ncbi:MAG: hypothetical protein IT357_02520 [Gemmatimonadaceae bacterium]|nr:hypothetical protein [Gemmatimonadaceae bacterium]